MRTSPENVLGALDSLRTLGHLGVVIRRMAYGRCRRPTTGVVNGAAIGMKTKNKRIGLEEVLKLRVPEALVADLREIAEQRRVGVASAARWLLSSGIERERALAVRGSDAPGHG